MTARFRLTLCVLATVGLAACSRLSEDPLRTARNALAANNSATALVAMKQALQQDPQRHEARALLASTLLAQGDSAAAAVEFDKLLRVGFDPNTTAPALARAWLQSDQAARVIDELASRGLDDPRARAELKTALALAYLARRQPDSADAAIGEALAADQRHVPARILAIRLQAATAPDQAVIQAQQLVVEEPTRAEAQALLGELQRAARRDLAAAKLAYEAALRLDPRHAAAHAALVGIALEQRDLPRAQSLFAAMKQAVPQHLQTRFYEGVIALQQGDAVRAHGIAQELIKAAPQDGRYTQLAAEAEFRLGNLIAASSLASQAAAWMPQAPGPHLLQAQLQMRQGQYAQALATLQPLLAASPPHPDAVRTAAEAALSSGDLVRAEQWFNQAARSDPSDPRLPVAAAVSRLLQARGAPATDHALAELETLAATDKSGFADAALVHAWMRQRNLDRAQQAVIRAESKHPTQPQWPLQRGRIALLRGDIDAARTAFEAARNRAPTNLATLAAQIELDLNNGQPQSARRRAEAVLALEPQNTSARLALADVMRRTGATPAEVLTVLEDAQQRAPRDPRVRQALIAHHHASGNLPEALAAAQAAVGTFPEHRALVRALGQTQLAAGERLQAVATFKQLVAQHPREADLLLELGNAHLAAGDTTSARQRMRQALELAPDSLLARRGLLEVALASGQPAGALEIARQLQKERPKHPEGLIWEADVLAAQKRWDAAAGVLRQALPLGDGDAIAVRLHSTLLLAGKDAEATRFATEWLARHPRALAMRLHLGDRALANASLAEAEAHYRGALAIAPNQPAALNNLAWILTQQRRSGATELAERANRAAPGNPFFMDTWAMALAVEGKARQALELQQRAVELAPRAPRLRLHLARIASQAGDAVTARAELARLADLGDRFDAQAEVTELLKSLAAK